MFCPELPAGCSSNGEERNNVLSLSPIEKALYVIDSFNVSARRSGLLQETDSRIKVLGAAIFILTVLSFNKYAPAELIPYIPALSFLTAASGISFKAVFLRIAAVSPFVLFIGVFNPFFDHTRVTFISIQVSGGWVSYLSIIFKFVLTVWCSLLLISTTRFQSLVAAMKFFKVPNALANQFYFLFRYLRLFLMESLSLLRARQARLGLKRKFDIKIFATLAGVLAIRSVRRSGDIHNAMLARGFSGDIPDVAEKPCISRQDIIFLISSLFFCLFFRFWFKF